MLVIKVKALCQEPAETEQLLGTVALTANSAASLACQQPYRFEGTVELCGANKTPLLI